MIGRRGLLGMAGGLAAMVFRGGDPGTGQGGRIPGGLPARRPDQAFRPIGPQGPVGSTSSVVRARQIIIYGTGETGMFEYEGTPGKGNPPIAYAVPPGVTLDPYRNTLPVSGGIVSAQQGGGGNWAQLFDGQLNLQAGPPGFTTGSLNEQAAGLLVAFSGAVNSNDSTAQLNLASAEAVAAGDLGATIVPGPLGKLLGNAEVHGWVAMSLQAAPVAPPPSGGGILYVDTAGDLYYYGPSGTSTKLASA